MSQIFSVRRSSSSVGSGSVVAAGTDFEAARIVKPDSELGGGAWEEDCCGGGDVCWSASDVASLSFGVVAVWFTSAAGDGLPSLLATESLGGTPAPAPAAMDTLGASRLSLALAAVGPLLGGGLGAEVVALVAGFEVVAVAADDGAAGRGEDCCCEAVFATLGRGGAVVLRAGDIEGRFLAGG